MKIYWTLGSIPELTHLSAATRKQVWRQCYGNALHATPTKIAFLVVGLCTSVGVLLFGPLGGGIGGGIGGFLFFQVVAKQMRPYLGFIPTKVRKLS